MRELFLCLHIINYQFQVKTRFVWYLQQTQLHVIFNDRLNGICLVAFV